MENSKNLNEESKQDKEMTMHDIMLKQQALLLQQFEALNKERDKAKEREDEIDLTRLVPGFLKKRKKGKKESDNTITNSEISQNEPGNEIENKDSAYAFDGAKFLNNTGDALGKAGSAIGKAGKATADSGKAFLGMSADYIALVWKNQWISFLLGFIGLGIGLTLYFTIGKVYTTEMVVSRGKMTNTFYSGLIVKLQTIVENQGYAQLARKLNISVADAEKITGIQYADYIFIDESELEEFVNDSTILRRENPFFKIEVSVSDISVLSKLESGIYNYFIMNPYVTREKKVRKLILTNKIEKFNSEIIGMDSLKYAVIGRIKRVEGDANNYFVKPTGMENAGAPGGIILSQDQKLEIDPMVPFQQTLEMANARDKFEEELIQIDDEFSVVDSFAEVSKPSFPRLRHVAFLAIGFGLFGGLLSLYVASVKLKRIRRKAD